METVVLVIIALLVIGVIVRQVIKSSKGICCSGCALAKKDSGCPGCMAAGSKKEASEERGKPNIKLYY